MTAHQSQDASTDDRAGSPSAGLDRVALVSVQDCPEMIRETGIADGGCMGVIISRATHDRLCQTGDICRMVPPSRPIAIGFGTTQAGTQEVVVGEVSRPGFLIDAILVVQNIAATLIGDDVFTDKGILLLKDAVSMLCVYNTSVLATARRVPQAEEGTLWLMDFPALCRLRDPRLTSRQTATLASVSKQIGLVQEAGVSAGDEDLDDGPVVFKPVEGADPGERCAFAARRIRFSPQSVRLAERVIARSKIGPLTLAKIVAAQAWRGIPDSLSPSLIKGVAERREDIPYTLTHSKSTHALGSGIPPQLGWVMYMDIWGKYPVGSNGVCFIAQFGDAFCGWGKLYALKGKDALLGAMKRFLTLAKMYGHEYKQVYSDCAGEVKDQFVAAAAEMKLEVLKAAPEQLGAGPAERNTQTLLQEMAWRLLAQENLSDQHYFYAGVDALEARNACLNGSDPTKTPEEQFTGKPPEYVQRTAFAFGALAASKVIGPRTATDVGAAPPRFELVCVVVSPNSTPGRHWVLQQGKKTPVIRRDLKRIGQPTVLRTKEEWAKLRPEFSPEGQLLHFHSPAKKDFTLSDLMAAAEERTADPVGLPDSELTGYVRRDGTLHPFPQPRRTQRNVSDLVEPNAVQTASLLQSMSHGLGSAGGASGSASGGGSGAGNAADSIPASSSRSAGSSAAIPDITQLFATAGDETEVVCLPSESEGLDGEEADTLGGNTLQAADDDDDEPVIYWSMHATKLSLAARANRVSFDEIMEYGDTLQQAFDVYLTPTLVHSAFAVRVKHTPQTGPPNMSKVMASQELRDKWAPPMRLFIDTGLAEGGHFYITPEQVASGEYTPLPHVNVFDEKRIRLGESTPKLKYRLAPDGSHEKREDFLPGSIETAPAGNEQVLHIISMAAALDLQLSKEDDKNAFPRHNAVSDPAVKNPRKLCTWLNGWQTGDGVGRYLAFATLTNGLRDASAIFDEIKTRELLWLGFRRTAAHRSVYYKNDGQGGFMTLAVIVDDSVTARTRNPQGQAMYRELQLHMAEKGFQVVSEQLDDCPQGITFAGMDVRKFTNGRGSGLAVTMRAMVEPVQESVDAFDLACPGQRADDQAVRLPMTAGWTPLAAAQAMRSGENRAPVLPFLKLAGQMLWVESVAPRSCVPSVMCSFSKSPGMAEWACLVEAARYFLATSHLPLMFYHDPQAVERGVTVPMRQFVYVDAGAPDSVDGVGRMAHMFKMGEPGTNSGGYIFHTRQIVEGASTIADETTALAACIPRVLGMRFLSEELAGQRCDPYDTQHIPGQFKPTVAFVDAALAHALVSTETGDTDCPVRTQSMLRLQRDEARTAARIRARPDHEPTTVFSDSLMVVGIVHLDGKLRQKNTRSLLRQFGSVHQAQRDGHIAAVHLKSGENLINQLSKLPLWGPLAQANGLEGMLGKSDEMDAYLQDVRQRFGKQGSGAVQAMIAASPEWLASLLPEIATTPLMIAFSHKQQEGEDVEPPSFRHPADMRGLGEAPDPTVPRHTGRRRTYALMAGHALPGELLEADATVRDYATEYLALGIPDPTSVEGERLCQRNTEINVDRALAGQVERLILAHLGTAVQLAGIDSLEELKSWEDHQQYLLQQNAKRAVSLTNAVAERFAAEDAALVRAAFVVRRQEEQRVDQPLEVGSFQMISCSSQLWVDEKTDSPPNRKRGRSADGVAGSRVQSAQISTKPHKQSYKNSRRAATRAREKGSARASVDVMPLGLPP